MNTALNKINNLETQKQRNLNYNATLAIWPHQTRGVEALRHSLRTGHKRPLYVAPTGSGKSYLYGQIIQNLVQNMKKVLWIVHRRNLVFEMQKKLTEKFDIKSGIIMSGVEHDLDMRVQLCSIQTYGRRLDLDLLEFNKFYFDADVVMIDEAHRATSKTYKKVIDLYRDKILIGCTATPCKADGRGLGEVFDDLVEGPTVRELTDDGFLCPVRYFVPNSIDVSGVTITAGDYQIDELENKVNKKKLIGDIVENWLRLAENRKTLVYAVNVKHSMAIAEAFESAGVSTARLDAHSSDEERDEVFYAMERGDVRVLVNVLLYVEGLDVPSISCVVFARPTKSLGLYRQAGGRGLRVEDGKDNLIFIDHANVVYELGTLDDEVEWTLDGKERAERKSRGEAEKRLSQCRVCKEIFSGTSVCPRCGTELKSFGKPIEAVDAELVELKSKRKTNRDLTNADKRRLMGMLTWMQHKRGWKPGRTAHLYREITSVWPNKYKDAEPIEPCGELQNLIKYAIIKSAKRYQKEIAK